MSPSEQALLEQIKYKKLIYKINLDFINSEETTTMLSLLSTQLPSKTTNYDLNMNIYFLLKHLFLAYFNNLNRFLLVKSQKRKG